jgi:hypothetical protein
VLHEHPFSRQQDPENIELIRIPVTPVTVHPNVRRSRQFALLSVIHGLDWVTELSTFAGLHFHERNRRIALGDEVDIAPTIAKAAVEDPPPVPRQPPFGDALAEEAKALIVVGL